MRHSDREGGCSKSETDHLWNRLAVLGKVQKHHGSSIPIIDAEDRPIELWTASLIHWGCTKFRCECSGQWSSCEHWGCWGWGSTSCGPGVERCAFLPGNRRKVGTARQEGVEADEMVHGCMLATVRGVAEAWCTRSKSGPRGHVLSLWVLCVDNVLRGEREGCGSLHKWVLKLPISESELQSLSI